MNKIQQILFFLLLATTQNFLPAEKDSQIETARTHEEKINLFKTLGVGYISRLIYDEGLKEQLLDENNSPEFQERIKRSSQLKPNNEFANSIIENQSWLEQTSIRWINEKIGYGLFAETQIPQGTPIGLYAGKVTTAPQEDTSYQYAVYPYNPIHDSLTIDAKYEGNETRFINGTTEEYSNICGLRLLLPAGHYAVVMNTTKTIKKNDQLLADFGPTYFTADPERARNFIPLQNRSQKENESKKTSCNEPFSGFKKGFFDKLNKK